MTGMVPIEFHMIQIGYHMIPIGFHVIPIGYHMIPTRSHMIPIQLRSLQRSSIRDLARSALVRCTPGVRRRVFGGGLLLGYHWTPI